MMYKKIISDMLKNGKIELPYLPKNEFIAACMSDFDISEKTAQKVYAKYHRRVSVNLLCHIER